MEYNKYICIAFHKRKVIRSMLDKYKCFKCIIKCYLKRQEYIHCEIVFPIEKKGNQQSLAYGVFQDTGVFEEYRTFTNPNYEYINLKVTSKEYDKILKFCQSQIGKEFDWFGAHISYFWAFRQKNKWWCGPFVVKALQKIKLLKYYKPETLSIDNIYYLCKEQGERNIINCHPNPYLNKFV